MACIKWEQRGQQAKIPGLPNMKITGSMHAMREEEKRNLIKDRNT